MNRVFDKICKLNNWIHSIIEKTGNKTIETMKITQVKISDLKPAEYNPRTIRREKEQAEIMQTKWGDKVVKYDFKKSTNPRINIPIKGI